MLRAVSRARSRAMASVTPEHQSHLDLHGYCVIKNVVDAATAGSVRALIDELLGPEPKETIDAQSLGYQTYETLKQHGVDLLIAGWHVAVCKVGSARQCTEYNDRNAHVVIFSLVLALRVVVQPTIAQMITGIRPYARYHATSDRA